jgi:DNA-binding NarL/FixJ family response regulator
MSSVHVNGTIRRLGFSTKASAYLQSRTPYKKASLPDLVLFDLADLHKNSKDLLRSIAFGQQRTPVPVVLLTSPATECLLQAGDIDGGEATMFSPRTLASLLKKLVGQRQQGFLKALSTLYEYGPILARQPERFLQPCGGAAQRSA